ncbi:MAG TPA: segregation/condensation protein A [Candidatus Wallbacteria bacterium]|nr:segregation/condensation protein A [Candidatus Wallbacteria bacterium]
MEYTVKLPAFEGPFDLLFHLIEKDKLDLNDIPLAKITSGYLEMIETMQKFDIHIAGEFLVMAASLLRLKSLSLLPKANEYDRYLNPPMPGGDFDLPENEEDSTPFYFESQEDMVNKLKEYKVYKDMAHKLRECESVNSRIIFKQVKLEAKTSLLTDDLNIYNLAEAFKNVINNIKDKKFQRIVVEKVSVEDKIDQILKFLNEINEISTFSKLLEFSESRHETVMTFLAVLELSKLQKIAVEQCDNFSEIVIKPNFMAQSAAA